MEGLALWLGCEIKKLKKWDEFKKLRIVLREVYGKYIGGGW